LAGNWSHWQPVRIRKMIPLSVLRKWAGGRPVPLRGQNSLRIGSIRRHSSSGTSQIVASGLRRVFLRPMVADPVARAVAVPIATTSFTQQAFRRLSDSF
jgi:hypothetical protein